MDDLRYIKELEKFQKYQLDIFQDVIMPYFEENLTKDFKGINFFSSGRFMLLGIEFRIKLYIKVEERTNLFIKNSYIKLFRVDNKNYEEILLHRFTLKSIETKNEVNLELQYLYVELKNIISETFRRAEEFQIYPAVEIS